MTREEFLKEAGYALRFSRLAARFRDNLSPHVEERTTTLPKPTVRKIKSRIRRRARRRRSYGKVRR